MPKYRLPDEPTPGPLAKLVVQPMWPLLVSMLAGPWLGWPWFLVNAHAVGSPSKWRQVLVVAGGLLGSVVLFVLVALAFDRGVLRGSTGRGLAAVAEIVWKAGIGYWLFAMQARSVELFEYYRGVVRNGLPLVIVGAIAGDRLLAGLPDILWLVLR